ncbi:MAG: Crp/Fnr family transcriptional regulator [Porticoccaceae bacterium]|nr:Crp/Fnr family transcriptional regulator [Porticoccaceae bacterium]
MPQANAQTPLVPLTAVNRLIARLPQKERTRITTQCEAVELVVGDILCEAGEPFKSVYFPVTGIISLVKILVGHEPLETELIGNEGMLGVTLVLGVGSAPQRGLVQGAGTALRMQAPHLLEILKSCPTARRILNRYLYVVMLQLSQTAGCSRFHNLGPRLARCLLMAHDRIHSNHFHLTHQFLANMLGVQRGGVTIAAGILQKKKIIRYSRGEITILNRQGLEAVSCECYQSISDDYRRLFS